MRELARCLAWTVAVGVLALVFALFSSGGLERAEAPLVWLLFIAYAPYYLMVHLRSQWPETPFVIAVFAAQFLWFLAVVAAVRQFARRR